MRGATGRRFEAGLVWDRLRRGRKGGRSDLRALRVRGLRELGLGPRAACLPGVGELGGGISKMVLVRRVEGMEEKRSSWGVCGCGMGCCVYWETDKAEDCGGFGSRRDCAWKLQF
jgi:hypothetical protein